MTCCLDNVRLKLRQQNNVTGRRKFMNINIYYGGRGLLDDPTLYVIDKMQEVLKELNVQVERYNLFEQKNSIATLPQTLKEVDGIILASTVEWYGIGGYMQQFLDACWLYGDKEKISTIYMQPVVMSTTYGEKEGQLTLINSWEILGGLPCNGLCGYVDEVIDFEMNKEYTIIIEKKAENLYRTISQKLRELPTSNQAVKQTVLRTKKIELTPQESEQLSNYVSDDVFVKKQKEDIQELTSMFKNMMVKETDPENREYIKALETHFVPEPDFKANYLIEIDDIKKSIVAEVNSGELKCYYGNRQKNTEVISKLNTDILDSIIFGRMTFQRAFMTGDMTAKGDFKTLRMLDQIFVF